MATSKEQAAYRFGPFVLSLSAGLMRGKIKIKLQPKGLEILVCLVANAPHLITKEALFNQVWPDIFVQEDTLNSTLSRLRKKLGDNTRSPIYIETEPTKGYRFICPVEKLEETGMKESAKISFDIDIKVLPPELAGHPSFELFAEADHNEAEAVMFEELAAKRRARAAFLRKTASRVKSRMFESQSQQKRADHCLNVVLQAEEKLTGHEQVAWFDRLDYEYEEILEALHFYAKYSMSEQELRLAIALGRYWNNRGTWVQGREILKRAIAHQPPGISMLKARGLTWAGHLATRQNDFEDASHHLTAGLTMSQSLKDQPNIALTSLYLGFSTSATGKFDESKKWHETNLQLARILKSDWLIAASLRGLGFIAQDEGDYQLTKDLQTKALTITEKIGDNAGSATSLDRLAIAEIGLKDYDAAHITYQKALALMKVIDKTNGLARCYVGLGKLQERRKNYREACSYFEKSLSIFHRIRNKRQTVAVLEEIGKIAKTCGENEHAARIYGAADALRESIAAPLTVEEWKDHGGMIASVQHLPGWGQGHKWSPEQAIEYILKGYV